MKIIAQAPTRIGLFGGGTDTELFASTHGGIVINLAINLRQYFTLYTKDNIWDISQNTVPYGCSLDFAYAFTKEFGFGSMHHCKFESRCDDIIESGLGSSASAGVAMVAAMSKAKDQSMSRTEIAEKTWEIETRKLGLFGGKQDQYAAAFGGLNVFKFGHHVETQPFDKRAVEQLLPSLVLFHTNMRRKRGDIQDSFKQPTPPQIEALHKIKELAILAIPAIESGNVEYLGRLLDESWELKKQSNAGATNPRIDAIYTTAKEHGALGGKICGAGGGGFMFFIIDPGNKQNFVTKMTKEGLEWHDFGVDYNGCETRILP